MVCCSLQWIYIIISIPFGSTSDQKRYSSTSVRGTIYCSNQKERNVGLPSDHITVGAKVIYAAAPAMGHNQGKNCVNFTIPTFSLNLLLILFTRSLFWGISISWNSVTKNFQESHPECNSRVPAILTALEKMKLTSK
ncbi:hypothetical protein MTR67_000711 [Solanum verrucosum]|uniref:Uncharacterized protein n=1 Tax=Solanum verrucosum TaxID=315347 RepID=A0AAF0T6T5_SOLVR|nr:hypothetical protein MTR67_000711 [Solanum verrucosum]